jgi:hypothetical protein
MERFTSKYFLGGVLMLGTATSILSQSGSLKRPNIIFILTDDQRADALGYTGNKIIQTPERAPVFSTITLLVS